MEITVLYVEDCPNLAPLLAGLEELLAGRHDTVVTTRLVTGDSLVGEPSFHGSPTVLVDGRDPFPHAVVSGPACRSYVNGGSVTGRPGRAELAAALGITLGDKGRPGRASCQGGRVS